ncbi:hypothetical protein WJ95_09460 [Burkholderia ubonensis]|uniref:hypothetical protein n=1 Tax=Burkholderia ubonensis TaxID=101571 RepID=UPI000756B7CF|nr:hypothetical protein [Burkholderia ubonensis]KVP90723.1 hypothetical protein WJ95_09460 [Burkholderia ubonensis]
MSIYNAANVGLGSVLGSQSIEQLQKQMAGIPSAVDPDTVRNLTERAHQAIEILEHELGRLVDLTHPVREPVPRDPEGGCQNAASAPEAINSLQILLARIDSQTRTVRQIIAELRI